MLTFRNVLLLDEQERLAKDLAADVEFLQQELEEAKEQYEEEEKRKREAEGENRVLAKKLEDLKDQKDAAVGRPINESMRPARPTSAM